MIPASVTMGTTAWAWATYAAAGLAVLTLVVMVGWPWRRRRGQRLARVERLASLDQAVADAGPHRAAQADTEVLALGDRPLIALVRSVHTALIEDREQLLMRAPTEAIDPDPGLGCAWCAPEVPGLPEQLQPWWDNPCRCAGDCGAWACNAPVSGGAA